MTELFDRLACDATMRQLEVCENVCFLLVGFDAKQTNMVKKKKKMKDPVAITLFPILISGGYHALITVPGVLAMLPDLDTRSVRTMGG